MSTARLPNPVRQDKARNGRSSSSNGALGRKPPKAPPGALINRLADPSMSSPADTIPARNGNGKAALKTLAPAVVGKDGHEDLPNAGERPAVDGPARRVQKRKVSDLKPHPLQADYFPDESEEADLELAADLDANGQRDPIDIVPNGTILCGHRRVKAAKRLEWKTIDVVVHHELANDEAAAEAFFIGDNYTRRQLTTFQKVRCAKRRVELAKLGKVVLPEECDNLKKTRDKIGYLVVGENGRNLSGREAERYLRVLKTPIEVQHACDAGHLSLVDAGKVAGFFEETQQQIAEQLRAQGPENVVLQET
ncbi:MAG: ParB N-terminal domain-containing protein [Candidatus Nealsonbacteria bacterium]|nr:ParB N-terminal domain-containing protein [Candidatus Nealsonbacteria bacterium]